MRKLLFVSLSLNVLLTLGFVLVQKERAVQALAGAGRGAGALPSTNGDVNCDGALDISDPVWLLGFLFLGGPPPCNFECMAAPVCGNGIVELPETCDDGDTLDGDGCSSTCEIESACGDGVISGTEVCDGVNLGGRTCVDFGFIGGTLACGNNCEIDTSGCLASACGDGVISAGEQCDGANLNGHSCQSFGFLGGSLVCGPNCEIDTSGCTGLCGDDIVAFGEQCDGANLGGHTCESLGFNGGSLGCGPNCEFDTSGCN